MRGQSGPHCRAQNLRHIKHKLILPSPIDKSLQLILEILPLLSRESWHGTCTCSTITLCRQTMAGFAIYYFGLKVVLCDGGGLRALCTGPGAARAIASSAICNDNVVRMRFMIRPPHNYLAIVIHFRAIDGSPFVNTSR